MPAVVVAAPAPIFVDTSQGTPGNPSPTGGVMSIQGEPGMYPVTTSQQGPVGVTGPVQVYNNAQGQPLGVTGPIQANQGNPATLANAWPHEITDGTHGPVAVKAANTPAVAADPALVVTMSPDSAYVGVTGPIQVTQPTGPNLQAQIQGLGTVGVAVGNLLSIQGVTGAIELPVVSNDNTASGALGALNASVPVLLAGTLSVGFQLSAGTLIGTIVPEISFDGGITWNSTFFDDPVTCNKTSSIVFGSANTATARTIVGAGGAGLARVRVSAYTSGTANITLRGSQVKDPSTLYDGQAGVTGALPPATALVGGSDGLTLRSMRVDDAGSVVITPEDDLGNVGTWAFGGDNRLRVGQETLLFFDTFEGGTVNNVLWAQSTSSMVQAQSSSLIDLNSTSILTSGAYSILTSTKSFFLTSEYPLYAQFKARLVPKTNAVIELGFGTVATTAAPTNGCFLRIDSSGNMRVVMNFGGTETTSATIGTLNSNNYYSFEIFILEDAVRIDIDNGDGSSFSQTVLPIPLTQATNMTVSHIPVFARVYNSSATATAADIIVSGVSVQQLDLATYTAWEEQMSGTGRGAIADPLTGVQLQNYSNSAAPATIAAASLSNTAAAYTTLGGLFAFNTPAGAETDYIVFAYQVPTGFTAFVWTIQIGAIILGAQSSTTPTVLQWGVAVGSSAVSLATGSPNPPVRQTIGFQQAPKTANVGDSFNPANLTYSPKVPLVCFGGKFIHIIVRVVSGNLTAGQINRGFVNVDGFLQ